VAQPGTQTRTGVLAQPVGVGGKRRYLQHLHAAFDPAIEGAAFVAAEVVPGLLEHNGADRPAGRLRLLVLVRRLVQHLKAARVGDELFRHALDRHRQVDETGSDGALGHAGMARTGMVGRLRERQAAMLLDGLDAERAVAAGAGEHDADGIFGLVLGKGGKERVDRRALAAVDDGANAQSPLLDLEDAIGRHHIDVIGLNELVMFGDQHRHTRVAPQYFRQHAFPPGREVGDDDEGHAGIGRHGLEQIFKRFHASSRGADANDWKARIHWVPVRGSAGAPLPEPATRAAYAAASQLQASSNLSVRLLIRVHRSVCRLVDNQQHSKPRKATERRLKRALDAQQAPGDAFADNAPRLKAATERVGRK
jgi:hypothetical protein